MENEELAGYLWDWCTGVAAHHGSGLAWLLSMAEAVAQRMNVTLAEAER